MPFGKSKSSPFDLEEPEPLDGEPPKKPPKKKTESESKSSASASKKPPTSQAASPPYRSGDMSNGGAGYMDGSDTESSDLFGGGGMGQMGAAAMGGGEGVGNYGADFGQKLASDIDSVIQAHGLEQSEGRGFAANLFGAISDCLARAAGGGGAPEPEAAAVEMTEAEEPMDEEEEA